MLWSCGCLCSGPWGSINKSLNFPNNSWIFDAILPPLNFSISMTKWTWISMPFFSFLMVLVMDLADISTFTKERSPFKTTFYPSHLNLTTWVSQLAFTSSNSYNQTTSNKASTPPNSNGKKPYVTLNPYKFTTSFLQILFPPTLYTSPNVTWNWLAPDFGIPNFSTNLLEINLCSSTIQ